MDPNAQHQSMEQQSSIEQTPQQPAQQAQSEQKTLVDEWLAHIEQKFHNVPDEIYNNLATNLEKLYTKTVDNVAQQEQIYSIINNILNNDGATNVNIIDKSIKIISNDFSTAQKEKIADITYPTDTVTNARKELGLPTFLETLSLNQTNSQQDISDGIGS